ncbi:MAG: hypothetical protein JO093_21335 [Acidobacteria bacterium]|nr:hypothetical protein [Acidobacteriota bacterium]MBV9071328.1 hypothetical protein [Acidobacteriota bacterium]MBV9188167.1 hypothetical protein [Acidobacteriota bacterium]
MSREFSRRDLAAIVLVSYAWFALLIVVFDSYPSRVLHCGDNPSYAGESAALRGQPAPELVARHFLGYPLLAAPVAALLHTSDMNALPIVSIIASLVAIYLAGELWGAWAAAWFAVINLDWIQRSLLGGAEPLFVALIFACLVAARKDRWTLAAIFGALATVVRPLGIFALIALGVVLLRRRRFGALALAIAVSLVAGGAYLGLVHLLFGQSFGNFTWYQSMGLGHDRTFIPFVTIFMTYAEHHGEHQLTAKNLAKTLVWMTFSLAGVIAAFWRREMRESMRTVPVEWIFASLYAASFLFFPAWWIEGEYPRYLAPVIPMLLVALRPWLPSDRRVIWIVGLLSVTLSAVEDMPMFREALRALVH